MLDLHKKVQYNNFAISKFVKLEIWSKHPNRETTILHAPVQKYGRV